MVLIPKESKKILLLFWNEDLIIKQLEEKRKKKEVISKWQQEQDNPFLDQVEELVKSLRCSLCLQSDVNYYDWYKWNEINTSSQVLNYWKQLWLVTVTISCQAKVFCITSLSENSVGVNSSQGTSCRFWLTT